MDNCDIILLVKEISLLQYNTSPKILYCKPYKDTFSLLENHLVSRWFFYFLRIETIIWYTGCITTDGVV